MRLLIYQAGLRSGLFAVATFSPVQILCFAAFLAAGGAIVYVLFGYPLLLGWIAKRHNHPVKKDDQLRSVSIIIAVRNGEKFIRRKLESVLALNYPRELVEIIVVSDGSDDRTDEIACEFEAQRVRLLRVPRGGKAIALNAAVPCASGEILIFTDVRQQVDTPIGSRASSRPSESDCCEFREEARRSRSMQQCLAPQARFSFSPMSASKWILRSDRVRVRGPASPTAASSARRQGDRAQCSSALRLRRDSHFHRCPPASGSSSASESDRELRRPGDRRRQRRACYRKRPDTGRVRH